MTLLLVEVDTRKIAGFPVELVPVQIDKIIEPYHLKWSFGNYYTVEEGFDEEVSLRGALEALKKTPWLRNAAKIQVIYQTVRKKLEEINTEAMAEPLPDKMERCRKNFQNRELSGYELAYPNPIMIDREGRLIDGYTTYLIMKERGMNEATCILVNETDSCI